jgi:hypothetical protein
LNLFRRQPGHFDVRVLCAQQPLQEETFRMIQKPKSGMAAIGTGSALRMSATASGRLSSGPDVSEKMRTKFRTV